MRIATTCTRCGRQFEPSPKQIRDGNWQRCTSCTARAQSSRSPPEPAVDDDSTPNTES